MIGRYRHFAAATSLSILSGFLALVTAVPGFAVCYVSPGGSGSCSSWADACSLQTALATSSCTEIWVKRGVYLPTTSVVASPTLPQQLTSFEIPTGVAVYGGFAGTETARADRDPGVNRTVLSGDIDGNDAADADGVDGDTTKIVGSNSFSVVVMDGTTGTPVTATTILDGFTITGGDDNYNSGGGGLFCHAEFPNSECSPTLTNLTFSGNRAKFEGGALFDAGYSPGASSPVLLNVRFSGNSANAGGAMAQANGSPTLTNVAFYGNDAAELGGAMYNNGYNGVSSPILDRVTFSGNTSGGAGGAMYNDGEDGGVSNPQLTNVTLTGNSASYGGAIQDQGTTGTCSPTLTNVTIAGNSTIHGGAIDNEGSNGASAPVLTNVILWDNGSSATGNAATPTISHSVIEGGCASVAGANCGAGNVAGDPKLGPLQNNGGTLDTMALLAGSSAIDAGDDGVCPAADERGAARPVGAHCDIGAYEAGGLAPSTCVADAHTLCIDDQPGDKRYRVTVSYHTTLGGGDGLPHPGNAIPLAAVGVTHGGLFWFFDPTNPEMLIKVIDGSNANGHRWVFYSAGTSVGLTTIVQDTQTGASVVYTNPDQHPAPPVLDTAAFTANGQIGSPYQQVDRSFDYGQHFGIGPGQASSCATTATSLCIGGRFLVQVSFHTTQGGGDGQPHPGHVIALSSLGVDRGGLFWFFGQGNPEMLIKVLNACPSTGHFWVFYSAGTNVGLTTTVEDTTTHMVNTYTNDDKSQAPPLLDTAAFSCP